MNPQEIQSPKDIKSLSIEELERLAIDIRTFLIDSLSKTGGHLSSNLGVVELTIALHYVFNSPTDKLLFDVGHQSYVHKILTGRVNEFHTLRQYKGISGFQKRRESVHDVWEAGHSSTSLSAALAMAVARDLNNEHYQVIPFIGDGALSGGMSIEALNQIGSEQRDMVIIFNDNEMSISKNVGALDSAFTKLRTSKSYNLLKEDMKSVLSHNKIGKSLLSTMTSMKNSVKESVVDTSIFGELKLDYLGPVDGHDLKGLIKVLKSAKRHKGPIVIHVITKKGKGYSYAENDQLGKWHGVSPFNKESGEALSSTPQGYLSWSEIVSETLVELAKNDEKIIAITPAMISGSKLQNFFDAYPKRAFDCGIAEEHAATFAAGLAASGKRPFLSIYSSFLQRAYDQVNHDIARMDVPVVIGVDRCGLVGEDGDTHHGVFDVEFLRCLPNLIVAQGKNAEETQQLLYTAFHQKHPFALRYPRGTVPYHPVSEFVEMPIGVWEKNMNIEDSKVIVIAYGPSVETIISKIEINKLSVCVVNARYLKPLDELMLTEICQSNIPVIIYETDMLAGGLSSSVLEFNNDHGFNKKFIRIGIKDHYVEHGSLVALRKQEHIDTNSLFAEIMKYL